MTTSDASSYQLSDYASRVVASADDDKKYNNNNDAITSSSNTNNNKMKILTTSHGAPIETLTASMTFGKSNHNNKIISTGPIVLQDFILLDHLAHFDRERIPERVVHAKGAGGLGYFIVTNNTVITKICKASIFQYIGQRTKIAIRFSTVGGESGSADTVRDPRGFAIKFYTNNDGNWDLVGNNTPIFFIRDPILFPSFIHTQKRNPVTHCKDSTMMWDFISLRPETIHQITFLFSDRGIPNGYRYMNGYGSHTYKNVNDSGEVFYVKYHFKTDQGIQNLSVNEANQLSSNDPDYSIRDLYNAIETGNYPSWTVYIQYMTYKEAHNGTLLFDPFDLTKIWSLKDYPLYEVGRIYLNENPSNYYTQIEQIAFSPSHMISGIEPSPDKMLQARLFSYPDTHRHRLGSNYHNIPINQNMNHNMNVGGNYQRDGPMQTTNNGNGSPNYFPNSFNGPQPVVEQNKGVEWHKDPISTFGNGHIERIDTGGNDNKVDNYSQCCDFFISVLNDDERERLTTNIAESLVTVTSPFIQKRVIHVLNQVHTRYRNMVQNKMKNIIRLQQQQSNNDKSNTKQTTILNPPRFVPKGTGPPTISNNSSNNQHEVSCPYAYSSKL